MTTHNISQVTTPYFLALSLSGGEAGSKKGQGDVGKDQGDVEQFREMQKRFLLSVARIKQVVKDSNWKNVGLEKRQAEIGLQIG